MAVLVVTRRDDLWSFLSSQMSRSLHRCVDLDECRSLLSASESVDGVVMDLSGVAADLAWLEQSVPVLWITDDTPEVRLGLLGSPSHDVVDAGQEPAEIVVRMQRLLDARDGRLRLRRAEAALVQANAHLERFAYTVSHDLSEPLRAITGFSQLLGSRYRGSLDERAMKFLDFIIDGATRMASMIGALREFSETARTEAVPEEIDLAELVGSVVADLRLTAHPGAEVIIKPLPHVFADPNLLRVVLRALLDNALKFRSGDDPHVVSISARRAEGEVVVEVADSGTGIPEGHRDRVWEMFTRLHSREEFSGVGMGLPVAAMAMSRMDGSLMLTSTEGEGTAVTASLPSEPDLRAGRAAPVQPD